MWAGTINKIIEPQSAILQRLNVFARPLVVRSKITNFRTPCERIIPSDAALAQAIYHEGQRARDITDFHSLGWLSPIAASEKSLHAIYATGLLQNWKDHHQARCTKRGSADALLALAVDATKLAVLAPHINSVLFECACIEIKKTLQWAARSAPDKYAKGIALLAAHLAFEGLGHIAKPAHFALQAALEDMVMVDGGVQTRSAEDLIAMLSILMPLRDGLVAANESVPQYLHTSIERMLPLLRTTLLGDGEVARFARRNEVKEKAKLILRRDKTKAAPLQLAPYAGLARIEQGAGIVVADVFDLRLPLAISDATEEVVTVSMHHDFVTELEAANLVQDEQSDLLQIHAQGYMPLGRDLFVGGSGSDFRAEEVLPQHGITHFHFGANAKIVHLSSEELTLTIGKTRWTLKQRGGAFERTKNAAVIALRPDRPDGPATVNWALRKHA